MKRSENKKRTVLNLDDLNVSKSTPEQSEAALKAIISQNKILSDQVRSMNQLLANHFNEQAKSFIDGLQGSLKPLLPDSERAKRLVAVVDGVLESNKKIDLALQDIQAVINEGAPLSGQDILFLVLQARGVDVYLELRDRINSLEPLAAVGEGVSRGGKKGHTAAYGTDEDKAKIRRQWQSWVNEAVRDHPSWTFEDIKRLVVKLHPDDVSVHQLKRYTKDPREK